MKHDEQTKILLDMLHRAMAVINDLAGHYQPCWRLQQEIDDLLEGIQSPDGGANLVCAQAAGRITEVCDLLTRQVRWSSALAQQLRLEGWVDADFETLRDGLNLDK